MDVAHVVHVSVVCMCATAGSGSVRGSADLAVGIASFGAQNLLVQALFQRSEYSMLELVFTRLEISARSRQNLHKLEALP